MSYTLGLLSEMASAFYYGRSLGSDTSTASKMMKELPALRLTAAVTADDLIRSFVTYMANKVNAVRPVDTFILLVDEASWIEKDIVCCFQKDVLSSIRSALLNSDVTFDGGSLKLCLAISSLSVGPALSKLEILSSRAIAPIILPSQLDTAAIANTTWNPVNILQTSENDLYKLQLIATTVNSLPRLVKMVRDYINDKRSGQTGPLVIDAKFVRKLFTYLNVQIGYRYQGLRCPRGETLRAIIFGDGLN